MRALPFGLRSAIFPGPFKNPYASATLRAVRSRASGRPKRRIPFDPPRHPLRFLVGLLPRMTNRVASQGHTNRALHLSF